MKTIQMTISERVAISRRHNPVKSAGAERARWMTNMEMEAIILDLYGLKKLTDDVMDLTFAVEDDKKYMMYLLRGVL